MANEEKKEKEDSDDENKLILKLDADDSALIVRTNGSIELVSRELQDKDENYVGDLEDLNRTFTLVLAFAAALENESLYNDIFQNLNHVLHKQWNKLPTDEKTRIQGIRKGKHGLDKDEWMNKWREEIEKGRRTLDDFMEQNPIERDMFSPEPKPFDDMETKKKPKKKKRNPLLKLKDMKWDPNDESLTAHFKDFRADAPPDEED
tara:strand:- start:2049 stop:2663 length:615 start_codon:yes stop_codon:yes gene_type:complete